MLAGLGANLWVHLPVPVMTARHVSSATTAGYDRVIKQGLGYGVVQWQVPIDGVPLPQDMTEPL